MYRINKSENSVSKLENRLFKDLHIREREHLQEWIADNPEMLGEELLIIQKEYDGFNDTNERLDLLALDKDGSLVIIENKLDDSGRDVVWQALKYTSYCSTLTTEQIIKIYQQYLDKYFNNEISKDNILEFLEREDDEIILNSNDQRIIFVANNYRKEVTSTVLWLINHDVQIKCIKATPYSMGEDVFLQMDQIIPLPETQEFMIDAKEKEKEKKEKSKAVSEGDKSLINFWSVLKVDLNNNKIFHIDRVSSKPHYNIGFFKGAGKFAYCIGRTALRVELYFSDDKEKILFDKMREYEDVIQQKLNKSVVWERLDNKKASRIKMEISYRDIEKNTDDFADIEKDQAWIDWYRDNMEEFYKVIYPIWEKVQKELK